MEQRTVILGLCMISHMCASMLYSMQAPFYPGEASNKRLRPSQYSLAFSSYELTGLIVSPLAGLIIKDVGSKSATSLALFCSGTALIIYGFLKYVYSAQSFLIFACLLRILEAFGTTLYLVCGFTVVSTLYSEAPSVKTSMLITSFYIGMTIGPVIGGALFTIGGFILPFLTLAPNLLIVSLIFSRLLPNTIVTPANDDNKSVSMFEIIKIPGIWIGLAGCCSFSFCQGVLQPTLAKHMETFGMTPQILSLMFIISPAINCMTSPLFGYLIQWGVKPRILITIGIAFNILCFGLIGPLPVYPNLKPVLWMCVLALVFNGMSAGMLFTSGFSDPLQVIQREGYPSTEETNGIISSLSLAAALCGGFVGPVVGGTLQETMGMSMGSCVIILVNVGVGFIMGSLVYVEKYTRYRQRKRLYSEETTRLLSST